MIDEVATSLVINTQDCVKGRRCIQVKVKWCLRINLYALVP